MLNFSLYFVPCKENTLHKILGLLGIPDTKVEEVKVELEMRMLTLGIALLRALSHSHGDGLCMYLWKLKISSSYVAYNCVILTII